MAHAGTLPPTPQNQLLFEAFEWHTQSTPPPAHETHSFHSHWSLLTRTLPELAVLGVNAMWIPPGCKANSPQGNGYDCYDLWDLGEFDQKWTRSTKWGSREELRDLIFAAEKHGVEIIWDAVLNHKTAGDTTDEAWAVEVDQNDRRIEICPPKKISAWLRYDFPGRERYGMKYSPMKWRAEHFSGSDWDQRAEKHAIYKLIDDPGSSPTLNHEIPPLPDRVNSGLNKLKRLSNGITVKHANEVPPRRPGKGWAEDVDKSYGNYDYLMFSNIWYTHPEVRRDVLNWGEWMIRDVGIHGFRIDAAQHFSSNFAREWIARVQAANRQKRGKEGFMVSEVWSGEVRRILAWLDTVTPPGARHYVYAFDAPLLYNFSRVSEDVVKDHHGMTSHADLRTLLTGPGTKPDNPPLVSVRPEQTVTLVANHDTQPGETMYTPMNSSLKSLFYAFILLRREGHPCVFWGDMFGTKGPKPEEPACQVIAHSASRRPTVRHLLKPLMLARKYVAYGAQRDYFDDRSSVGWTRGGTHDRPGCAVLISVKQSKLLSITKRMAIGRPGERWVRIIGGRALSSEIASDSDENIFSVTIDHKGFGEFRCCNTGVSVYVEERVAERLRHVFPRD